MNQVFSVNEHVQSTGNHLQHTNQQNFVAHTFLSMNRYSLSMDMSRVQAITCSTLISRTLWHTLSWAWTVILCQWTCPVYRQSPAAHNQQNFVAHTFLSMNRYSLSMDMSRVQAITCSTLISRTLWHTLSWAWTIILCQWTCPEYRQSPAAHCSAELCGTHFPEHEPLFSVNEHVQSTGNHLQHTNQQNFVAHTFLSMNRYSLSMNMSRVQAITCSTLISRTLWHTLSWAWTVILCQWTCPEYRQSPAAH